MPDSEGTNQHGDHEARILMYDDHYDLEADPAQTAAVGDTLPVFRGNGPGEGDVIGTATVTAIGEDGGLEFRLDRA
ncbi:MAG TPA: hypothetical protein VMJ65_14735 [Solirubrobacteraceae bacterium]|nr:hypothetical protein [Solirubrobacteraceae bacterium]